MISLSGARLSLSLHPLSKCSHDHGSVDHLLEKIEEREKEIEQRTLERQKKKEAKLYQPLKLNPGKVRPENKAELLHSTCLVAALIALLGFVCYSRH